MKHDAEYYMKKALKLAEKAWGKTSPNPLVGALVVKDGEIVGRGHHERAGEPHAEVHALRDAGDAANGADLYVTLEPCSTYGRTPPCTDAIIAAGIRRVFIGCTDPNPQHAGGAVEILQSQGIECHTDILSRECASLNEAFFHWIVTKRPFVLLKMAMTLDGKIATVTGESKWITGRVARRRVQKLRQWADAVLVGGGTVRMDRPSLRVRVPEGHDEWENHPRRLVATRAITPVELRELMPGEPAAEIVDCSTKDATVSLLEHLGAEGVTALLVEGGGELAGTLLQQGLVDKVEFHIAPKILGGRNSIPVIGGENPQNLIDALHLKHVRSFALGADFAITGYC